MSAYEKDVGEYTLKIRLKDSKNWESIYKVKVIVICRTFQTSNSTNSTQNFNETIDSNNTSED